jgi:hypothetical protein
MNSTQLREPRTRWRITLDELCYAARIDPVVFDAWATSGYLGKRLATCPAGGRARHITRETAQRTVLMARLVWAGLTPVAASHLVTTHHVGDEGPLVAELAGGVTVSVPRSDLP